jgi:hypothetical protein
LPIHFPIQKIARIGFLLLLLAKSGALKAQATDNAPILYSITEQNGLSDNSVTCFSGQPRLYVDR